MSKNRNRSRVSVADVAKQTLAKDVEARANAAPPTTAEALGILVDKSGHKIPVQDSLGTASASTVDSFVNFAQKMGVGADNALSTAGYGFNPITRVRTTLEWIHRGSWLGGVAVDLVADDMTREGIDLQGANLKPDEMTAMEECAVQTGVWNALNETIKWARLYGGCIAVMMIDGQDYKTPLRLDTIGKGQFKGLLVLDRWMVEPSLNDLVTEAGPNIGLPKYYTVTADAPALPRLKIHHSRCIRIEGVRLPYWQRVQENLWGISVLERLYDRMISFDSASTGASQLVYKAYIRTYKINGMRELVAAGGDALNGLVKYVDMMRRFQGIEGITLLDGEDEFEGSSHSAFGGLAEVLTQFGQQLSGALQIPLVRLFGQSPSGFSTGDTDMKMYYDTIHQQQEKTLRVGVTNTYRAIAMSEGIKLKEGFRVSFRSLRQLDDKEKSEIANTTTDAVTKANEAGLISDKAGMQELRQSSHVTGIFSNITDEQIDAASEDIAPPLDEGELNAVTGKGTAPNAEEPEPGESIKGAQKPGKVTKTGDGLGSTLSLARLHDLSVVIENVKGAKRYGPGWEVSMPADYGYLRGATGADGDQVDCYVGPNPESNKVWIIDQVSLDTDLFDEHKVMLGFNSWNEALRCYVAGYSDGLGLQRIGAMEGATMPVLKAWLEHGKLDTPYGDLK